MKKALRKLSGSIQNTARLYAGMIVSVLFGLGISLFFMASGNDAVTPQTLGQSIQSHLNEISFNLTTYIQNHDPFILDIVKEEQKQLGQDVHHLVDELQLLGNEPARKRLEKAHNGIRDAISALLLADQEVITAAHAMEQSRKGIGPDIFQKSRRTARMTMDKFLTAADGMRKSHTRKMETLNQFNEWREMFEKAVQDTGSLAGTIPINRKALMLPGLLLLAGIGIVVLAYRRIRLDMTRPVQDILQCVDAAASGDMSRAPDHWASNEIGQLSQAVGRLISVLARSENLVYHLAALVESSGDAIISHTLEGKVLSWNKGAQRIYGYSADEMKGQSIETLADEKSRITMKHVLERIQEGERIQPFETTHVARNGRKVRTFVRVAAIYDSTREIIGASFIAEELTAAKAAALAQKPVSH